MPGLFIVPGRAGTTTSVATIRSMRVISRKVFLCVRGVRYTTRSGARTVVFFSLLEFISRCWGDCLRFALLINTRWDFLSLEDD